MVESKYSGTKGMTSVIATKRVRELFTKYKLNTQDETYLEEAIVFLELNLPEMQYNNKNWNLVYDNLSAKQWQKINEARKDEEIKKATD